MDSSNTHPKGAEAEPKPTQTNIHPSRQANFNPNAHDDEEEYDDADDIGTEDEDEAEIAAAMGFASFGKGKGSGSANSGKGKVVKEVGRASKRRRMDVDVDADVEVVEQGNTARVEMEQEIGTGRSATALPQRLVQIPLGQPEATATASRQQPSLPPPPAGVPLSSIGETSFVRQPHPATSEVAPKPAVQNPTTNSTASERSQQETYLLRTTGLRDPRTGDLAFFKESFVEDPWKGWRGAGAGAGAG